MIKLKDAIIEGFKSAEAETQPKILMASLVADTKEEVIAIGKDGSTIKGLSSGDEMSLGSTCLCANGDFGILNSSGVWTF